MMTSIDLARPEKTPPREHETLNTEFEYRDRSLSCASRYLLPVLYPFVSGLAAGSIVMDLGCGNGSLLHGFAELELSLHGIECSGSGVAEAKRSYPALDIHFGDLTQDLSSHPLAGKCDLVISTEVIEH